MTDKSAEVSANAKEETEAKKTTAPEPRTVDPVWHDQVSSDLKKVKSKYQKLVEDIKAKEKSLEEKQLKEKGDYQELEKRQLAKIDVLEKQIRDKSINEMLYKEAAKHGLNDMDLLQLVDRSSISVDESGSVTGVKEAIETFKTSKPSFFSGTEVAKTEQARPDLSKASDQLSPEAFVAMGLAEKTALREKNPREYEALLKAAKDGKHFRQ